LKLSVEGGILTIEGHVKREEGKDYFIKEFEPTNYYRQFELSDAVDQEGINAELKNGVLNIFLPRAKAVQPRTIEVKFS
jgi:HSP20 family molecular chaperone IbpA